MRDEDEEAETSDDTVSKGDENTGEQTEGAKPTMTLTTPNRPTTKTPLQSDLEPTESRPPSTPSPA